MIPSNQPSSHASAVPIPSRLQFQPLSKGLPILFTTAYVDGLPDFRVTDPRKREECFSRKLCGICGTSLDYWMFFVTGSKGIKNRTFGDPPNHKECLEYALQVCPFLGGKAEYTAHKQLDIVDDPNHIRQKPDKVGLYQTRGYRRVQVSTRVWLFLADPPFAVEWRGIKDSNISQREVQA